MPDRAVLFDLDGTLLDTLRDLADSMNAVLAAEGLPTHPVDAYRTFVGDGIVKMAERSLPPSRRDAETVERTVAAMKREYDGRWDASTAPYDGVADMLEGIAGREVPCAVLSNKPHDFTVRCVERFFDGFDFAVVRGVSETTPPKPDPRGALAVAETLGVAPGRFLYLGDTNTDMRTAACAGMVAVGASWGFRDERELEDAGARIVIDRPTDLLALLDDEE